MEKCAALVLGREGLLVGRSIALMGKIWENDANKSWYIDTWMAEGAIPDRWEHLAALMKASASETGLEARFNRKVQPIFQQSGSLPTRDGGSVSSAPAQDPAAFAAAVAIAVAALIKPAALTDEAKTALTS